MEDCNSSSSFDDICAIANKNLGNKFSNILDLSSTENISNRLVEILKHSVNNKFSDFLDIKPLNENQYRLDYGLIFWIVNQCSIITKNYFDQQVKNQNLGSFGSKKLVSIITESITITITISIFEAITNKLPISKIYLTKEDFRKFYSSAKVLKILETNFANDENKDNIELYVEKYEYVAKEIVSEFLNFIQ